MVKFIMPNNYKLFSLIIDKYIVSFIYFVEREREINYKK